MGRHHPGVRPAGHALGRDHGVNLDSGGLEGVDLVRPGGPDDRRGVGEVGDLVGVQRPVLGHPRLLRGQQGHGGIELGLGQLVRVGDPQGRVGRLEVERRIGDVDRAVVVGDLALIGLRRGRIKDRSPARGRRADLVGPVHQGVAAPAVGDAVVLAVDRVVGG